MLKEELSRTAMKNLGLLRPPSPWQPPLESYRQLSSRWHGLMKCIWEIRPRRTRCQEILVNGSVSGGKLGGNNPLLTLQPHLNSGTWELSCNQEHKTQERLRSNSNPSGFHRDNCPSQGKEEAASLDCLFRISASVQTRKDEVATDLSGVEEVLETNLDSPQLPWTMWAWAQ